MKMVMLTYNETLESDLLAMLARLGIKKFTELAGAHGHGEAGGTHLGTPVYPSLNRVRYMVLDDAAAAALLATLRAFREQWKTEGVQAFSWPCETL